MRELAERCYFRVCLALGWLLRSARYSTVRFADEDGSLRVRKQRRFYAPVLVWCANLLFKILDAGVRVLPQREWIERECTIARVLRGASIATDSSGTLSLPWIQGDTLAKLLERSDLDEPKRAEAIRHAVVALAELHALGFTHGDAMAENVVVDERVAYWIDFETAHEFGRSLAWRRADDLRALVATCVVRTPPARRAETLGLIVSTYADETVSRIAAGFFASPRRRSLGVHLGQAALSWHDFRQIAREFGSR